MWRVREELFEIVTGCIVEVEPGCDAELSREVFELFCTQLSLAAKHFLFGRREHTIEPAQDGERQDHVLVFAALEGIADQIRDAPDKTDDLAMIHDSLA